MDDKELRAHIATQIEGVLRSGRIDADPEKLTKAALAVHRALEDIYKRDRGLVISEYAVEGMIRAALKVRAGG